MHKTLINPKDPAERSCPKRDQKIEGGFHRSHEKNAALKIKMKNNQSFTFKLVFKSWHQNMYPFLMYF